LDEWDIINNQIKRSKIKRVNWKEILGMSLTKAILLLKKENLSALECYTTLRDGTKIKQYLIHHFSEKEKILTNLYISVNARYGESKTEALIFGG